MGDGIEDGAGWKPEAADETEVLAELEAGVVLNHGPEEQI